MFAQWMITLFIITVLLVLFWKFAAKRLLTWGGIMSNPKEQKNALERKIQGLKANQDRLKEVHKEVDVTVELQSVQKELKKEELKLAKIDAKS